MKWKLLVMVIWLACTACASMSVTRKDGSTVNYNGPPSGVVAIVDADAHAHATDAAGEAIKEATRQGKPVSVHSQNGQTDVQTGYMFFGQGLVGAGMLGGNPANMTAGQLEAFGPGLYPPIGVAPIYYQPGQAVVSGSGGAPSSNSSIEERLDRVERVQKVQVKNELKRP